MKQFVFIFFLSVVTTQAQLIYSVDYKSQSDVNVFVVDYKSQADLLIYKVDYKSQAKGNEGLWFFGIANIVNVFSLWIINHRLGGRVKRKNIYYISYP